MKLFHRIGALPLLLLSLTGLATAQDEGMLQRQLNEAIARGEPFRIPAGTFRLSKPLRVPGGVSNLQIIGAGPDRTILKPSANMNYAIEIGGEIVGHNLWPLAQKSGAIRLGPLAESAKEISAKASPGYYLLWDQNRVIHQKTKSTSIMNRAEIVRVTGSADGRLTIDRPLGREYTMSPSMVPIDQEIGLNLKIEGVGYDGSAVQSQGFLQIRLVRGVEIRNCEARGFRQGGFLIALCEDVKIENCFAGEATDGGWGNGYGFYISRSKNVSVVDCKAKKCRHGFIAHGGSRHVRFERCVGEAAGFDTHGMGEGFIHFIDCRTVSCGIAIGNDAWQEGTEHVTVVRMKTDGGIQMHPNVKDVRVTDSTFKGVNFFNMNRIGPSHLVFTRCRIEGPKHLINNARGVFARAVRFEECSFKTETNWGRVIEVKSGEGDLSFNNCTFETQDTRAPFRLISSSGLDLRVLNCKTIGRAEALILVEKGYQGKVEASGTQFASSKAGQEIVRR